jgi:hypothetical protein
MENKISDERLKAISTITTNVIGHYDFFVPTEEALMATELLQLRADALTSQSHNAAVIDRIAQQLRDAGYSGTLSEMVDAACDYCKWYDAEKIKLGTSVNVEQGTAMIIVNPNDSDKFLPQPPEVTK